MENDYKGFNIITDRRMVRFRAMKTDNNEWVYGYYIYNPEDGKTYIGRFEKSDSSEKLEWIINQVRPETVGQYTNVETTDRRYVYEDDLVKTVSGDIQLVKFYLIEQPGAVSAMFTSVSVKTGRVCGISRADRVIGDRFNNPELMEA